MKTIVIIPARLASKRFPRKALFMIDGQTLLQKCYRDTLQAGSKEYTYETSAYIATPDQEIVTEAEKWMPSERIIMTSADCRNGTERVAEAANIIGLADDDIVINVQADQFGFENGDFINVLIELIEAGAELATVVCPLENKEELDDPNIVKANVDVVVGRVDTISWFARTIPPAFCESSNLYRHVGVYAARKKFFDWYFHAAPSPDAESQRLEQLRWLGKFAVCYLPSAPITIDTVKDSEGLNND